MSEKEPAPTQRTSLLLATVERFQTLIAGALGFAAIVVSIWMTDDITRRLENARANQSSQNTQVLLLSDLRMRVGSVGIVLEVIPSNAADCRGCTAAVSMVRDSLGRASSFPFQLQGDVSVLPPRFLEEYETAIRQLQMLYVALGDSLPIGCSSNPSKTLEMVRESADMVTDAINTLELTHRNSSNQR